MQLRHPRLDHESPTAAQMGRGVLEAGDLGVLRGQVEDHVEDEVDVREIAVHARGRHVAGDGLNPLGAGLLGQTGQHRLRAVDPGHTHAALGQRQRDAAGADRELG